MRIRIACSNWHVGLAAVATVRIGRSMALSQFLALFASSAAVANKTVQLTVCCAPWPLKVFYTCVITHKCIFTRISVFTHVLSFFSNTIRLLKNDST